PARVEEPFGLAVSVKAAVPVRSSDTDRAAPKSRSRSSSPIAQRAPAYAPQRRGWAPGPKRMMAQVAIMGFHAGATADAFQAHVAMPREQLCFASFLRLTPLLSGRL